MAIRKLNLRMKRTFTFCLVLFVVTTSYVYFSLFFSPENHSPSRQSSLVHGDDEIFRSKNDFEESERLQRGIHTRGKQSDEKLPWKSEQAEETDGEKDELERRVEKKRQMIEKQKEFLHTQTREQNAALNGIPARKEPEIRQQMDPVVKAPEGQGETRNALPMLRSAWKRAGVWLANNRQARPQDNTVGAHDSVRNDLLKDNRRQNGFSNKEPSNNLDRHRFLPNKNRHLGMPWRGFDRNAMHRHVGGFGSHSSGNRYPSHQEGDPRIARKMSRGEAMPHAFQENRRPEDDMVYSDDDEYTEQRRDELENMKASRESQDIDGNGLDDRIEHMKNRGFGDQAKPESGFLAERFRPAQKAMRDLPRGLQRDEAAENNDKKPLDVNKIMGRNDLFNVKVKDLSAPVKDKAKCVPLRFGATSRDLCVYPFDVDTKTSKEVIRTGTFHEEQELNEFLGALATSDSLAAVDIGAGLGIYSLAAASQGRQVLAVEPLKDHQRLFTQTMQINNLTKQVTLVSNALGEKQGIGRIRSPHPSGNMGAVYVDPITDTSQVGSDFSNMVRIIQLDDVLPIVRFTGAVMKLDAQGDEELVLRGAHMFFQKIDVRYVLMHWLPTSTRKHLQECRNFLVSRGYVAAESVAGTTVYSDTELEKDINFVVWRKGKA